MDDKINASEFKAKCLKILDMVNVTKKEITILKHGKPVAHLVPYTEPEKSFPQEKLIGTARITGDVIEPTVANEDIKIGLE